VKLKSQDVCDFEAAAKVKIAATKANIEDCIAATSVNFEIYVVEPGKMIENDTSVKKINVNLFLVLNL